MAVPGVCHAIRHLPAAGSSPTSGPERRGRDWKSGRGPGAVPPPPPPPSPPLLGIPGSQATAHFRQGEKVVVVGSVLQTQISEPVSGSD